MCLKIRALSSELLKERITSQERYFFITFIIYYAVPKNMPNVILSHKMQDIIYLYPSVTPIYNTIYCIMLSTRYLKYYPIVLSFGATSCLHLQGCYLFASLYNANPIKLYPLFCILLTVHLNIFILILTNLMH